MSVTTGGWYVRGKRGMLEVVNVVLHAPSWGRHTQRTRHAGVCVDLENVRAMGSTSLTSGQAARQLGISKRTLLRAVQRGEIHPAMRSPGGWLRFPYTEVEAYARRLAFPSRQERLLSTVPHSAPATQRATETLSETRYKLITDLTSDYVYSFAVLPDGSRMLEWMSGNYEVVTGYSLDDMRTALTQRSLIYPDDLPIVVDRTRTLLGGQPTACEYRILTKRGQIRWVRDHARPLLDQAQGRVVSIVGAAQDITSQKHVEQEALRGREAAEELARLRQDQAQEAEAMARVSTALAGSLQPTELYRIILEQSAYLLPVDTSCLFLLGDGWVTVAATWGQPNLPAGTKAFRMDERLRQRWPKAGEPPLYCPDMRLVAGRTPREPWVGEHEVRSIITVPLAIDGELVGVFDVASTKPHFYTERHVRIAATLGNQVTHALRNARLYAAEQERTRVAEELARLRQEQMREAAALAEVSAALASALDPATVYQVILQQAARVLPFDQAEIVLYQDGWAVSAASLGEPSVAPGTRLVLLDTSTSTWQTLTQGRAEYLADTADVPGWPDSWDGSQRIRSAIVAPLLIDGVLLGSFEVNSYTPHFYSADHIRVAATFGERATQAVRNARLYATERERASAAEELAQLRQEQAEESRALAQVGLALAGILEPATLYEVILQQATQVLPGEITNLVLYQDGWATIVASAGAIAPAIGTRLSPLDGSVQFWLPGTADPAYLPDTAQEPTWIDIAPNVGEHRIRSIIVVPLVVDGVVVGSFDVCSTVPHFYTDRHVRLAKIFAERAGQALRNARLYAAEQAARRQAELAEANLRGIIDASPVPMVTYDHEGTVQSWNAAAEHIFGWHAQEVVGGPAPMVPHDEQQRFDALRARALKGAEVRDRQARWLRQDGSWLDLQFSLAPLHGAQGNAIGTIAVFADITGRKRMEEALIRQARHDALTGLPNRTLLAERLQHALCAGERNALPLALLLLDLDNFKEVNDTFGHHAGDLLLQRVAERLQGALRAVDTVARLGGDEFAILLPNDNRDGALMVAEKILRMLATPVLVEGHMVHIRASIGTAVYPDHGTDAGMLLRRADVAMYAAKRTRAGVALYAAELDQYTPDRIALLEELRAAIAHEELLLHYQPMIDLTNGGVSRVEVLVRWQHPRRGLVSPDRFIPLAEQTDLIGPLTHWVLGEALRQCSVWHQKGLPLGMNVNLSAANLHDSTLIEAIDTLLATHGLAPADLRLELTESAIVADMAHTQAVLTRLSNLGVRIAIDDYGTGYSSLAYLKRLPIDEIKIDKSFVQYLTTSDTDAVIVASTIGLGHNLGLRVVAEGAEDAKTVAQLAAMGCDAVQGYYFSRPLPPRELERWLERRHTVTIEPEAASA